MRTFKPEDFSHRVSDVPDDCIAKVGGPKYMIEGKNGFILTTDDLIHWLVEKDGIAELPYHYERRHEDGSTSHAIFPSGYIEVPISDIIDASEIDDRPMRDWVHYWGIKRRIKENYAIFRKSCREIDASIDLPKWGD